MTKLGLIADIHADVEALQLAIDLLYSKGANQILCAGDLVAKGSFADTAVDLIQQYEILCVQGNHDREVVENQEQLRQDANTETELAPAHYVLKDRTLAFLQRLPESLTLNWDEWDILVAHGAPWSDMIYVFPASGRHIFRRVAQEAQAKLVILGHTHVPMLVWVNNTWIANPGSVCGTFTSGSRTCGIFSLNDASFQVFNIANGKPVDVPYIRSRPS